MFLFGARDVWFVVALPVFLQAVLGWSHTQVGSFMACWVIGYGLVQSFAPMITGLRRGKAPTGKTAFGWAAFLTGIPLLLAMGLHFLDDIQWFLVVGLFVFGAIFAVNSSVHSFLILTYAKKEGVSLDVGFYYMANAMGRLMGTVLSGWAYQWQGLGFCLVISSGFLVITTLISRRL